MPAVSAASSESPWAIRAAYGIPTVEPYPVREQPAGDALRDLAALRKPLPHPRDATLDALLRRPARLRRRLLAQRLQLLQLGGESFQLRP